MQRYLKSPLLIAFAAAMLFDFIGLAGVADHFYWNANFKLFTHPVEQNSIIVSLDDGAGSGEKRAVGSTAKQKFLLEGILAAQPNHVYFDFPSAEGADGADDQALASFIQRSGSEVTMVARATHDAANDMGRLQPLRSKVWDTDASAVSVWSMNFYGYAQSTPSTAEFSGKILHSVATAKFPDAMRATEIIPDFTLNPETIRIVDSASLLSGDTHYKELRGKDVFVTSTSANLASSVGYFGHGRVPSAMLDIAAIQSQGKAQFIKIGEIPFVVALFLLLLVAHRNQNHLIKTVVNSAALLSLFVVPSVLWDYCIASNSGMAILMLATYVPIRIWQRWQRSLELTNSGSGLPNIEALTAAGISDGMDVVAAAIGQYDEMLANLPKSLHGECARQIARRLSVASGDSKIYATDNGHFVWLEQPRPVEAQTEHLEGLKALFASPLLIDSILLDTNIHFGLDRNAESSAIKRVQSALASAGEALSKGKLYEEFGQQRLESAPWELSLHARIDEGLRNGDIWLALQSQFDFRTGRISGAEALIRWNDPERGAIPPDAFILQAERAGRIEAITYWVLERAIEASKVLNAQFYPFQISVNLSARMADQPGLVGKITEIMDRHQCDCSLLTIEVTETFSMGNHAMAQKNLSALRAMGFRLSIDDFGTGQASLAYLADIPSDELKLDKRFIQAITKDKRERLIVRTVIKLAHALGQEIVAEGVEDWETLKALQQMNCDIAQGYYIGRPMAFEGLLASLSGFETPFAQQG